MDIFCFTLLQCLSVILASISLFLINLMQKRTVDAFNERTHGCTFLEQLKFALSQTRVFSVSACTTSAFCEILGE